MWRGRQWPVTCIAAAALSLAAALPARALNFQDLWYNPAESGWGIQIVQQADTIFATWFVYDAAGKPLWFTAVASRPANATGNSYSGQVAAVTGTYFGAVPFVGIMARVAGEMTLNFTDARTATLTYSYDGIQVVKPIQRQSLAAINLTGTYFGGLARSASGCGNPLLNGSSTDTATYSVMHTPSIGSLRIVEVGGTSCAFTGTTQQFGSILEGSGTYTCAGNGTTGAWTGREGSAADTTFAMRLMLRPSAESCTVSALIGGFKSP